MRVSSQAMCTLGLGIFLPALPGSAQDWPQWMGSSHDGKAAEFKAPSSWPKELEQKWKASVGTGDAGPALVGDHVFVFSRQNDEEVARCLDIKTGKEIWANKHSAPSITGPDAGHAGPRSSPAVSDGKLVTLGVAGDLTCVDATSGKELWRKNDFPGSWPRFHVATSPLIVDNQCIVSLGKPGEGAVVSYDLASGEAKWKSTGDGPSYATPALLSIGGTKVIALQTDKRVICLDAKDGKLLWEVPFAPQGMAYNASTPVVEGQNLIYCGQGRGATCVKLEKSGDKLDAKEQWKNPDNAVQFNTPVLKNNFLYGISARGEFFCINAQDGKTAWTAPFTPVAAGETPEAAGGGGRGRGMGGRNAGYGSIIDAGSVLMALTPVSQLVVFEPNEKSLKEVARIKVAETPVFAYPVLSGNRLLVKDQESLMLYAIP